MAHKIIGLILGMALLAGAVPALAQVEAEGTPQGDGIAKGGQCTVSDLDVFLDENGDMQASALLVCDKANDERTVTLSIVDATTGYVYVRNEWHPNKGVRKNETIFTAPVTSCAPGGGPTEVQVKATAKKQGRNADVELGPVESFDIHGCQ